MSSDARAVRRRDRVPPRLRRRRAHDRAAPYAVDRRGAVPRGGSRLRLDRPGRAGPRRRAVRARRCGHRPAGTAADAGRVPLVLARGAAGRRLGRCVGAPLVVRPRRAAPMGGRCGLPIATAGAARRPGRAGGAVPPPPRPRPPRRRLVGPGSSPPSGSVVVDDAAAGRGTVRAGGRRGRRPRDRAGDVTVVGGRAAVACRGRVGDRPPSLARPPSGRAGCADRFAAPISALSTTRCGRSSRSIPRRRGERTAGERDPGGASWSGGRARARSSRRDQRPRRRHGGRHAPRARRGRAGPEPCRRGAGRGPWVLRRPGPVDRRAAHRGCRGDPARCLQSAHREDRRLADADVRSRPRRLPGSRVRHRHGV